MASAVSINSATFWRRLMKLHTSWMRGLGARSWGADSDKKPADALLILRGRRDENVLYERSLTMMLWLFELEVADLAVIITQKKIAIACSAQKAKALASLSSGAKLPLSFIVYDKKQPEPCFKEIREFIPGDRIGRMLKNKERGSFVSGLLEYMSANGIPLDKHGNVTVAYDAVLASKSQDELKLMQKASECTTKAFKKALKDHIENALDTEEKVKHSKLAERIEERVLAYASKKMKLPEDDVEICYEPIVMSGGKFNLSPSASSNDDNLHTGDGSVVLEIGVRYKYYCANVARTFIINPTPQQRATYKVLEAVYTQCKKAMVKGAKLSSVWAAAMEVIEKNKPELKENFTKNCGFGTGISFRDSGYILNSKNPKVFRAGMTFNLCVGFNNLTCKNQAGQEIKYALLLADTMQIESTGPAKALTPVARDYSKVVYTLSDEPDDKDEEMEEEEKEELPRFRPSTARDAAEKATKVDEEEKDYQHKLEQEKIRDGLLKFGKDSQKKKRKDKKQVKKIAAYKSAGDFPAPAKKLADKLFVDSKREALLAPITGRMVPFHISVIKSVNHQTQGGFNYLRVNFMTPEKAFNSKSHVLPSEADPSKMFIQELSYRSQSDRLEQVFFELKELQRRVKAREKEKEQKQSLVVQESLRTYPKSERIARLRDVSVRPRMGGGKITGYVEIHPNGLRYITTKHTKLDIIYSNMKHVVFQKAEKNTPNVVLHLQLYNAIMVGKKKSEYVQFYYEVIESAVDIDHRVYGDQEAMQEEEKEQRNREKWNARFRAFAKRLELIANKNNVQLEVDVPFSKLAFTGCPHKEIVTIMPAVSCVVALYDNPPLVLTLDDVEVVSFERVRFNLKNFDMAFIFKDFTRPTVRIDAIPMKDLEEIKKWLRTIRVLYYESRANLIWKNILKRIAEDPRDFYENGGWRLFLGEEEEQDDDDEEESEDEASSYAPSGSEEEDSEEYASDDSSSDEEYGDSEDEEAEDWEELEKRARQDDRQKWNTASNNQPKRRKR